MLCLEYLEIGVRLPAEERAQKLSDQLEGHFAKEFGRSVPRKRAARVWGMLRGYECK